MSKPYNRRPQQQKGYQRNKKFDKKKRPPTFDQLLRAFKKKRPELLPAFVIL